MDPASKLSLVTSCLNVSKKIYDFIDATRSLNKTVLGLYRQTNGIANVLDALRLALIDELRSERKAGPHNKKLWKVVTEAVAACYPTVRELEGIVQSISRKGPSRNIWKQAVGSVMFQLKQSDVNRLLSYMQTHSLNLQLALASVQLMTAAAMPQTVAHELEERFNVLERMITLIDDRLDKSHPPIGSGAPDAPTHNIIAVTSPDSTTMRLREVASSVITSASTATGRTVSGSSQLTAKEPMILPFEYFDDSNSPHDILPAAQESTTGSEYGTPNRNSCIGRIDAWLEHSSHEVQVAPIAEETASTATRSSTMRSVFTGPSEHFEMTTIDDTMDLFEDSSGDDALDVQVVKSLSSRGEVKFAQGDFLAAKKLIAASLEGVRSLPLRKRIALNSITLELKYALCCMEGGEVDEAEENFLRITNMRVRNVTDAAGVLEAYHGLACLCLRQRKLEAAKTHCRQALRGRGRTKAIGRNHKDYHSSLLLLAVIHYAAGETLQAETYLDLLPEGQEMTLEDLDAEWHLRYPVISTVVPHTTGAYDKTVSNETNDTLPIQLQDKADSNIAESKSLSSEETPASSNYVPPLVEPDDSSDSESSSVNNADLLESVEEAIKKVVQSFESGTGQELTPRAEPVPQCDTCTDIPSNEVEAESVRQTSLRGMNSSISIDSIRQDTRSSKHNHRETKAAAETPAAKHASPRRHRIPRDSAFDDIPDDGDPARLFTSKGRVSSASKGKKSQSSLLIDYFEGRKNGQSRSKPTVRVKITPDEKIQPTSTADQTVIVSSSGHNPQATSLRKSH